MIPISILGIWKGMGWTAIIYLAGLQSVPQSLYEAAKVDGASTVKPLLWSHAMYIILKKAL